MFQQATAGGMRYLSKGSEFMILEKFTTVLTFLEDVDFVVLIEFEIEIFSVFG